MKSNSKRTEQSQEKTTIAIKLREEQEEILAIKSKVK